MPDKYPERYVAFIDILGFSNLIAQLDKDDTLLDKVCKLLGDIHKPPESLGDLFEGSDFKSATISDAVALSAAPTPEGLGHIFAAIEHLSIKLMRLGYFARGAVVKGRLFHNENMVLGSALVRAYSYESTVAVYPRIMLPREIVEDIGQFKLNGNLREEYTDCARRSKDGPHYLNVLRFFARIKSMQGGKREDELARLTKVRNLIQQRLDEAVDNPSHYQKVHWFADYWNDVFYGVDGLNRIQAPGLETVIVAE